MKQQLSAETIPPGKTANLEAAWALKERIRRRDGVLEQQRRFFETQYRQSHAYVIRTPEPDRLAGFAVIRDDGYLSMLGVAPEHRRQQVGTRLVGNLAADFGQVSCHTRVSNETAVSFYTELGFVVASRVANYYRDGDDAYRLVLTDGTPELVDRLTELL